MTDQVEEYNANNTLVLKNALNVKEEQCQDEEASADYKVHISETSIIIGNPELHGKLEPNDISIALDNIKTEQALPEVHYNMTRDNLKMEEEIRPVEAKIEIKDGLLWPILKQRKIRKLTILEKEDIVKRVQNGEKRSKICDLYKVTHSTVSRIVKKKEKYQLKSSEIKIFKRRTRIDRGKNSVLEDFLFDWFKQKRSLGISISGPLIQERALFFNRQLGGPEDFKASQGWLNRFKLRHGIRRLSVRGEKFSTSTETDEKFKPKFRDAVEEGQYSLRNLNNAEETGVFSKSLPHKTLASTEEIEAPALKETKERVTVMNCSNADGNHKVPLILIGKSKKPRCFKDVQHMPLIYRNQTDSWIERPILKRHKIRKLTLLEKEDIVKRVQNGEKRSRICDLYNVTHSTVSRIVKKKEKYHLKSSEIKIFRRRTRIDRGKNNVLEDLLFDWFKQKRSLGISISGPLIQERALFFNRELGGPEDFKASQGWLNRFKLRHGIRQLSIQGEKFSASTEADEKFKLEFRDAVEEGQYSLRNLYNADETGLFSKSLPRKTLASTEETETPGLKESKERVTVMNCSNADGSHKVPLLLIGKSKEPRCFKDVQHLPVIYRNQTDSWMENLSDDVDGAAFVNASVTTDLEGDIFLDWYENVFIASVRERGLEADEKVLLLLDNAPCHPSAEILNAIDSQFKVLFLPPNVAPTLQPMDQGVIECMKRHYRGLFLRRLIVTDALSPQAIAAFLKSWNLLNTADTVANAWSSVQSSTISTAWKNLLGETVAPVSNDQEEGRVAQLLNKIHSSDPCSAEEIQQWLQEDSDAPAWHAMSDMELLEKFKIEENVESQIENLTSQEPESNDESQDTSQKALNENGASLQQMYKHFDIFKKWYEKNPNCTKEQTCHLNDIQNVIESMICDEISNND